jgi:hypothetical protein
VAQTFNQAAVKALAAAVLSEAQALGDFTRARGHEPKNAPGLGLTIAIFLAGIKPSGRASGMSATSGVVTFQARVYNPMLQEPQDSIDPDILTATCDLMAAYSDGFTLDGTVRNIDLLGMEGTPLSATTGYVQQDDRIYRSVDISIPIVVNDLWTQEA